MKTNVLLICCIVFLVGCAHRAPTFKYISWKERKASLEQSKNWTINGSLGITHSKKRDYASFKWQQNQDNYVIVISGPLNLSRIKITGDADQVELCQSGAPCIKAKSAEQLLFSQFGWRLPISNMKYWILSLPAPDNKISESKFDAYGHITSFKQQRWKIDYTDFQPIKNNIDLPTVIKLQNPRLAIKLKARFSFY